MKTTRICLFLFVASFCLPATGLAQSNAKPDFDYAHKNAEAYQKHMMKEHQKQEKAQAKAEKSLAKAQKARVKQHQH